MNTTFRPAPGSIHGDPRASGLEGVLGLEVRSGAFFGAAAAAVALHLLLPFVVRLVAMVMAIVGLLFARIFPAHLEAAPPMEIEISPEPKAAPKEEPKEEVKKEPKEEPKEQPKAPPKEQPVAAAAQAGAVLTQAPKPDEPVDLTNSFVTGSGATYAGGTTMAAGTATAAVRAPVASPTGVVGGTGTGPAAPPAVDRSRAAGLGGSKSWNDCPFPPEADVDNIDQAAVLVQITVAPDGRASNVRVASDPGHGFGRAARACATQRRYQTALDRDGSPVGGTFSVNVTFAR
jgi:protein TonB